MPQRYKGRIIKVMSRSDYQPLKRRALARLLNVPEEEYGIFTEAVKQLEEEGRIVTGSKESLSLPALPGQITGTYQKSRAGYGFVRPDQATAQGDLFIPYSSSQGAMTGDRVRCQILPPGRGDRDKRVSGVVLAILERGKTQYVGTLVQEEKQWFVLPDGKAFTERIVVEDPSAKGARPGEKVVVDILRYPSRDYYATGVIVERLGRSGKEKAELASVIRRFDLVEHFNRAALAETRHVIADFERTVEKAHEKREDLTSEVIVTIDPVDARDFDDAISLKKLAGGHWELGVHIADVGHFVKPGGKLDEESRQRATSTYLPGHVIPMLPELLSNGICSLQQDQPRFTKTVFIRLDREGKVLATRFCNGLIRSTQRLTYEDAERILDGQTLGYDGRVVKLLKDMETLARIIQKRRYEAGMLSLDLPSAELVYDAQGKVIDARPESTSFPHTMIEMFMVEANEAAARMLDGLRVPFLRRVHPEPDGLTMGDTARALKLAGYVIPKSINRKGLQNLLDSVKGKPESFLINLAVLKSLTRAEYSPMPVGHYALASTHYCHFTSPIRRYPDLTVHWLLEAYLQGKLTKNTVREFPSYEDLEELGKHCSERERNSEDAEDDLRTLKILQMLEDRVGEEMKAVVTSITNFGLFVQCERFLVEGLIRPEDVRMSRGKGKAGGKKGRHNESRGGSFADRCPYRLGQEITVRLAKVNLAARTLDFVPA